MTDTSNGYDDIAELFMSAPTPPRSADVGVARAQSPAASPHWTISATGSSTKPLDR